MRKFKLLLQIAKLIFAGKRVMNEVEDKVATLKPIQGEALRLGEFKVPDFWDKHKNKAWVAVLLLSGFISGTGIDEIYKAIPDVHDVAGLKIRVDNLEKDVKILKEGNGGGSSTFVPPSDSGFKAERPR
jgi:hypothetical protein